jgi:RNA polymerase sigma factor (sigma-70 family)
MDRKVSVSRFLQQALEQGITGESVANLTRSDRKRRGRSDAPLDGALLATALGRSLAFREAGTSAADAGIFEPARRDLYNRFLSERARQKRRGDYHALTQTVEEELPGVEGGQHSALEYRDFLRAFAALPEEQRSVLLLIAVEDLSYQQAAGVLGVPIGTVMSRLSHGRERLRHLTGSRTDENSRHRAIVLDRVT